MLCEKVSRITGLVSLDSINLLSFISLMLFVLFLRFLFLRFFPFLFKGGVGGSKLMMFHLSFLFLLPDLGYISLRILNASLAIRRYSALTVSSADSQLCDAIEDRIVIGK
ncbi:hypothetical protein C2G38_2094084 [Gigaspora rosea]|uniref:Uncharacterized protein n=1 Tax=Gigaspora rosea TaxID=44941 RepID=A0A397V266_9GLOM|nr:hypothetical protein C2G38_2094084 [Gigaspora rosea]